MEGRTQAARRRKRVCTGRADGKLTATATPLQLLLFIKACFNFTGMESSRYELAYATLNKADIDAI